MELVTEKSSNRRVYSSVFLTAYHFCVAGRKALGLSVHVDYEDQYDAGREDTAQQVHNRGIEFPRAVFGKVAK